MTQTFNEGVVFIEGAKVDGGENIAQLRVEGASDKTQPLQTWQEGGGDALARITADGRLHDPEIR